MRFLENLRRFQIAIFIVITGVLVWIILIQAGVAFWSKHVANEGLDNRGSDDGSVDTRFSHELRDFEYSLDINEYDYYFDLRNSGPSNLTSARAPLKVVLTTNKETITIIKDEEVIYKKDLDFIRKIVQDTRVTSYGEIPIKNMSFSDQNSNLRLLLIVDKIQGDSKRGVITIDGLKCGLFVKLLR